MAMVDMQDLLWHAYNNRYAVGSFEVVSLDFLQAVIKAAETARSPVILNIVEAHSALYDLELLMTATIHAARRASVPVAVHLDHCSNLEKVEEAIRLGCNSVKLDSASHEFPENVKRTREVVDLAHAYGVPVEGEIGYVTGMDTEDINGDVDEPILTQIAEAQAYIERTDVDFLAISIGTVHGRIRGKQRLDYSRLARLQEKVKIPFVIHGGTGLGEQQCRKLIDYGVARINYFTVLAEAKIRQLETNMKKKDKNYLDLFAGVREKIGAEVIRFMQLLNSAGRAAEVLIQCRPWRNVENVIICSDSENSRESVADMLARGQEELGRIPGVLRVDTGRTVKAKGHYTHCWLVTLVNEKVVENFLKNPIYEKYALKS